MRKIRYWKMHGASVFAGALSLCLHTSLSAQSVPVTTTVLNTPNDPNVLLANSLKTLAQNPYNVDALLSAGQGALAAGDPNAAIGFLARAEELSPRNPQVKMALGSALVQVERPQDALRIFGEAYALGVLEYAIASDRGLANDLVGDNKAAQKDYALAMKAQRNDELVRRYALSLAISGDKTKALDLLEPLTRRGDQAAWRAKAFALALNGDMAGADKIVTSVVPANMVGIMTPFIRRLPSLNQAQRARAVHFGTMPAVAAPSLAVVDPGDSFRAMNNTQVASVASPPVVTPAPARQLTRDRETGAERRRREKQERELAKLAERGRKASNLPASEAIPQEVARNPNATPVVQPPRQVASAAPRALPSPIRTTPAPATSLPTSPAPGSVRPVVQQVPPTPTVPAPATTPSTSPRLGQRVGPVDPRVLDPYIVPPQQPASAPVSVQRPVLVDGARGLPSPNGTPAVATSAGTPPSTIQTPRPSPLSSGPVPPLASNPAPVVASTPSSAAALPTLPSTSLPARPIQTVANPVVTPPVATLPATISAPNSPVIVKTPQVQGSMPVSQVTPPVPNEVVRPPATVSAPTLTPTPTAIPATTPSVVPVSTTPPITASAGPAPTSQLGVIPPVAPIPAQGTAQSVTKPPSAPVIAPVAPNLVTSPPVLLSPATTASPAPAEPVRIAASTPVMPSQVPQTPNAAPSGIQPSLTSPNPAPGFSLSSNTEPRSPSPTVDAKTVPEDTEPTSAGILKSSASTSEVVVTTPPSIDSKPALAPNANDGEAQGLGSIVAGLAVEEQSTAGPVPDEAEFRARQLAAKRKEEAAKAAAAREAKLKADALAKAEAKEAAEAKAQELAAAKKKAEEEEAKKAEAAKDKANPARLWVQVATGANRGGLPITWRKLKQDAPKALEGQIPHAIAFRATNRLLVGPFKSNGEARALIGKLAKEDVFASLFASEAGQEVTRLGGR